MRPMTNDTRIALEKIAPIAYELGIEVRADAHFLYCNGQAIGIGCNSAYATVCEFIAYAMYHISRREYRFEGTVKRDLMAAIKRYWCDRNTVQKMRELDETEASRNAVGD